MRSWHRLILTIVTASSLVLCASPAFTQQAPEVGGNGGSRAPAPTSTKPARWYVADWGDRLNFAGADCLTVITVTNLSGQTVNVDVEFVDSFNGAGTTYLVSRAITAHDTEWVWSSTRKAALINYPITANAGISTNSAGWALVAADHPKILASAITFCADPLGNDHSDIDTTQSITVVPVGATLELFQAGLLTQPRIPLGK